MFISVMEGARCGVHAFAELYYRIGVLTVNAVLPCFMAVMEGARCGVHASAESCYRIGVLTVNAVTSCFTEGA